MSDTATQPRPIFGWMGFALGAASLLSVLFVFWAGPFAPQQDASVTLGELAADIAKSAARATIDAVQPAPDPVTRDIDDFLQISMAMVAGLAVILGAIGYLRKEAHRPVIAAVTLGVGVILFQYLMWAFFALLGALIVAALLQSLGDTFSSIFGG